MRNKCNCCCKLIRVNCVTLNGEDLNITIPETSFRNKERRCLSVCVPFPESTPGLNPKIQLINGAIIYPCYTKIGNLARVSNIGCNRLWKIVFGDDPEHITIYDGLTELENCPCTGDGYKITPVGS